jgi:UDP-GlcNAc:undecaprenyl-phosphate GlcNAc-1-phosphate transferase
LAGVQLAMLTGWLEVGLAPVHGWLLVSASGCCGIGLYDDKYGMRPRNKLLLQIVAALPFVLLGRVINQVGMLDQTIHLGWWGIPITLFWITLCVNSVNLLDGLDGVAGTVGIVVSGTVCVMSLISGQLDTALIALALCGSLLGFLVFNWHPAKIFLGDSGSLTVGFLLGALAIEGSLKTATGLTLCAPLVLMSIPGLDTAMAVLRRLLNGKGIGQGDRCHLHHCLKDRGLSVVQIAIAIGGMCLFMGASVIAAAHFQSDWIAVVGCSGLLALLVGGRVFGHHETKLLWQHLRHLTASSRTASRVIQLQVLRDRFQSASYDSPYQAWDQLCHFIEQQEGHRLEFSVEPAALATSRTLLVWSCGERELFDSPASTWEFRFSAPTAGLHRLHMTLASAADAQVAQLSVDHLCQLLTAFCNTWPDQMFAVVDEAPLLKRAA